MGKFLDEARKDWTKILTSGGFEVDITLEDPDVIDSSTTVKGLAILKSQEFDFETGAFIRADKAHSTISIQTLVDASYPYLNVDGEVDMLKHKLTFNDSQGVPLNYVISQNFPDEAAGIITFELVKHGTN